MLLLGLRNRLFLLKGMNSHMLSRLGAQTA